MRLSPKAQQSLSIRLMMKTNGPMSLATQRLIFPSKNTFSKKSHYLPGVEITKNVQNSKVFFSWGQFCSLGRPACPKKTIDCVEITCSEKLKI